MLAPQGVPKLHDRSERGAKTPRGDFPARRKPGLSAFDLGITAWLMKPATAGELQKVLGRIPLEPGRDVLVVEDATKRQPT